jgi:DNA repair exonuclease SbcCD ATPase subunit
MKIKHKLLSDYQYTNIDKKIFFIKSGTIIEEYIYNLKGESINIDREIIEANPQIFEIVDWKSELLSYMRANKMPQPAQLGKKIIPFIEEMILSSMTTTEAVTNTKTTIDNSLLLEIESKENELFRREQELERKRISLEQKEDECEIKERRLIKKEKSYKDDLEQLETKENTLRDKSKSLIDKEFEIEDIKRSLDEKERSLELLSMNSAKEIDNKYEEIQNKLNMENQRLLDKDKELDTLEKELDKRILDIEKNEESIKRIKEELDEEKTTLEIARRELETLNKEITNWERLHWKFKRHMVPPSAIPESKNPDTKL